MVTESPSYNNNANGFRVAGSIVKIHLLNFMQYDEVTFTPGPHLNVLIGKKQHLSIWSGKTINPLLT